MTLEIEESGRRHPFRFMFKLTIFVGLVYAIGRFLAEKKNEYADLTESEARERLVDKMSARVGDETASEIADQVVPKLREKGLIKADPAENVTDAVGEAVESVVKK